jgi:hypothetical protein
MDLSIDTFHAIVITTATTSVVIVRDERVFVALPNPTQHSYFSSGHIALEANLLDIVIFQVDIIALEANGKDPFCNILDTKKQIESLVQEIFKFYHVGINGRKGSGLVGWLYNSEKQLCSSSASKLQAESKSITCKTLICSERDDEKYCKLLVIRSTSPKKKH